MDIIQIDWVLLKFQENQSREYETTSVIGYTAGYIPIFLKWKSLFPFLYGIFSLNVPIKYSYKGKKFVVSDFW